MENNNMEWEVFQVVWLPDRNRYQVSCRQLLGVQAMSHRFQAYMAEELPEGWEEKPTALGAK
uniref:Uncharacterized protein n=2 Tax=viral metagenome TaxID=1070528 RepID=A0A6H2A575_9ZZZZ